MCPSLNTFNVHYTCINTDRGIAQNAYKNETSKIISFTKRFLQYVARLYIFMCGSYKYIRWVIINLTTELMHKGLYDSIGLHITIQYTDIRFNLFDL